MDKVSNTPSEVIENYKRALTHAKGEQYSLETTIEYRNGWFHITNINGTKSSYRRKQMVFFIESLLQDRFDARAYSRARAGRHTADRQKVNPQKASLVSAHKYLNQAYTPLPSKRAKSPWYLNLLAILLGFTLLGVSVYNRAKEKELEALQQQRKSESEARRRAETAITDVTSVISPQSRGGFFPDPNSGFKTALGAVYVGTKLFYKSDLRPYGYVTAIDTGRGRVEVAPISVMSADVQGLHGYGIWVERSYVTENFVVEK